MSSHFFILTYQTHNLVKFIGEVFPNKCRKRDRSVRHTFFFVFSKTTIEKTHLAIINECFFLCPFSISPTDYLIRNCITVKFMTLLVL